MAEVKHSRRALRKMRKAAKSQWSNAEMRKKMVAGMKRAWAKRNGGK